MCHKLLAALASVAVLVAAGGGGGGDVISAGLVLQQGYTRGEHHKNWSQNSDFKLFSGSHNETCLCKNMVLAFNSQVLHFRPRGKCIG